tara:strand:+ start:1184 stop:1759 length:576 start_codon:yes stop_codon:yes gene_type:complete
VGKSARRVREFNAEIHQSYDVRVSTDGIWTIGKRASSVKAWNSLRKLPCLTVGGDEVFWPYKVVGQMLESADGNHRGPFPVVLIEIRQDVVDSTWTYMFFSYLYSAREAAQKVEDPENRKKIKKGRYLLSNHYGARLYNCFGTEAGLSNENLVNIDCTQFYDTTTKSIEDIRKYKFVQKTARHVKKNVRTS